MLLTLIVVSPASVTARPPPRRIAPSRTNAPCPSTPAPDSVIVSKGMFDQAPPVVGSSETKVAPAATTSDGLATPVPGCAVAAICNVPCSTR